jgi:hypothetical protein
MRRKRHFVLCSAFSWIACGERFLAVETGGNQVRTAPRCRTNQAEPLWEQHKVAAEIVQLGFLRQPRFAQNVPIERQGDEPCLYSRAKISGQDLPQAPPWELLPELLACWWRAAAPRTLIVT